MRVASNTLYNLSASRLNRVKYDLLEANTRVATGKKVNSLSDDPVAVAPILSLRSSIASVTQYSANIATGRQWLEGGETALSNVTNLITEAKVTSIGMLNGIISAEDYISGADTIEGIREHLLNLANTQVNGQYIFSGTKTNIRSFVPDDPDNPTRMVYQGGSDMFKIKMAELSNLEVGYCGDDVFQSSYLVIDDTNNKIDFREETAGTFGAELTAEIPVGRYSPSQLAVALQAVMTDRSAAVGQGEILNVSRDDAVFSVANYDALTVAATAIQLTYSSAAGAWAVSNNAGYPDLNSMTLTSDAETIDLDFTGNLAVDATVRLGTPANDGDVVTFDVSAPAAGGNDVVYSVNYNDGTRKYTISQVGGAPLDNLQLMWSTGSNAASSIGMDMGFDASVDLTGLPDGLTHESDEEVEWGIFRTLIELQGFLESGNADGINRSISRLSADFDYIGTVVSQIGIRGNRLDVRDNIIYDLNISYETTKMRLEDADMITEITKFDQKMFAYNAAMSATSKIIKMSLLDYL